MKSNIATKSFVIALSLLASSSQVYGMNVITATNTNSINQSNISVISSKDGEAISKMDTLDSVFRISFTDNNYVTTKFAKVTNTRNSQSYVPVYSEASNTSTAIGSIPVDSLVVIGKEETEFSQIFFDERIGYVENIYLVNSTPEESTVQIEDTEYDEPQSNESTGKYVKITAETGLNFRQDATTTSSVISVIPYNTYVDLLSDNGSWLKVQHNGQVGYISSQFGAITDKKEEISTVVTQGTASDIIAFAKAHLGKPYIYGSTNLNVGTDCSGFTYAVFKQFGINLNRVSRDQYLNGTEVSKSNLMPGDLVFFNTGGNTQISHVGIYIGDNQYIHSTDSKNQGVIISSLNSSYSLSTYYGARRVITQ